MRENFARFIGVIIFFGLFIGLLSLVGNPAKEETGIIFVTALVIAGFVYFKLSGKKIDI
jgi:hypothetical protein